MVAGLPLLNGLPEGLHAGDKSVQVLETGELAAAAREAGDDDYAFTEEEATARALRGMDEQKTVQNAANATLAADSAAGNSGRYIADNIKQWTDSAINGWRNGADQTELAEINYRVMVEDRDYTPEEEMRIKAINDRMKARSDADGAIVFSNAQVLGNMATGLHATDAVHGAVMAGVVAWMSQWALAGAGAGSVVPGAGTAAGAALGAFAGLTVWGAAKLGLAYANAQSTMRQEAASNYRTQIEAGVDRDTARVIASGVGLFNSLVEMGLIEKLGGIYSKVTGPLMDQVFRKKVAEGALQFARPTAGAAFKDFAKATGTGLFLYEPGEEVLQEVSQIVGEEVGKRFATDPEKAVPITAEEAASRLWDTYFETVKGVVLLQAAGGVPFLAHNIRRARAAQKNLEFVENVVQYAKESKAAKADKATVESFISSQAEEGHADKIYIEGAKLRQAMRDAGATDAQLAAVDPEAKAQLDRIERDGTGGDVVFDTGKFAVEIAGTDLGMNLKQHIRLAPDALSVAEAVEARMAAGKLVKDQLYWQEHPEEAAKRELDEQGRRVYDEYVEQLTRVDARLRSANPDRLPMTKEQISAQARLAALSAQSLMASTNLPYETVRRMLPRVRASQEGAGAQQAHDWKSAIDGMAERPTNSVLMLSDTPAIMRLLGATPGEVRVAPHVFDGIFQDAEQTSADHHRHSEITKEVLKQVPEALADPIVVFWDGVHHTYRFWLDIEAVSGERVVMPVSFTATGKHGVILNLARTAFSSGTLMRDLLDKRDDIKYVNRGKVRRFAEAYLNRSMSQGDTPSSPGVRRLTETYLNRTNNAEDAAKLQEAGLLASLDASMILTEEDLAKSLKANKNLFQTESSGQFAQPATLNKATGESISWGFGLHELPAIIERHKLALPGESASMEADRASMLEKLRAGVTNAASGFLLTTSKADTAKALSPRKYRSEETRRLFNTVIENLDAVVRDAFWIESSTDVQHGNGEVQGIHRFGYVFRAGEHDYFVQLTVRDYKGKAAEDRTAIHTIDGVKIDRVPSVRLTPEPEASARVAESPDVSDGAVPATQRDGVAESIYPQKFSRDGYRITELLARYKRADGRFYNDPIPHESFEKGGAYYDPEEADRTLKEDVGILERSLEQRAYHGSAYDFDKFTLSHVGAGAGAQVHGYGLYFTLDRSVADRYRSAVSDSRNQELRKIKAEEQRILDEKADLSRRLQSKRADADGGNTSAAAFLRLLGEASDLFGEEDAGLGTDADILAEAGQNNEAEIARLEARIAELDQRLTRIAEQKKAESEKGGRVYVAEIPEDSVMIRELAKFADQPEAVRRGIEAAFREQGLEAPKADDTGRHLYLELQDALGARDASLLLNRHGVKGVRYETPSDGECAVVWDEDSIAIRTELEQGGDASARGLYSPSENVITLTPNADLTTFAHEMSHAYLTQLFNLAAISDKDSRVARDAQILLKAFGLSSLEEYVELAHTPEGFERLRKMQEWWAYQSEMYLSRGTAADPKAAGILKKFGSWVRNVYAQYKGGADGYLNLLFRNEFGEDMMKMSDEVRGVMERMYSSEAAFNRSEAASGLEEFFKQKPEGMDGAMWSAYQEALEASKLEGIEKLQAASLAQMKWLSGARGRILKRFQQQHDAARGVAKDAAEAAVHSLKCMNLLQDMRDGVTAMSGNERLGLKFDRAWLETQNYKPEEIEKLRRLGLVTSEEKGGFPPNALANLLGERFGITTGREMIDLLMTVPDDVPALQNILKSMMAVAERMSQLSGMGDLDLREMVARAAIKAVNARREGVKLADYAKQAGMFETGDPATDAVINAIVDVFAKNSRSAKEMTRVLNEAASFAYSEATKPAEDMFGEAQKATRQDVADFINKENTDELQQQNLFDQQEGEQDGGEPAGTAEQQQAAGRDERAGSEDLGKSEGASPAAENAERQADRPAADSRGQGDAGDAEGREESRAEVEQDQGLDLFDQEDDQGSSESLRQEERPAEAQEDREEKPKAEKPKAEAPEENPQGALFSRAGRDGGADSSRSAEDVSDSLRSDRAVGDAFTELEDRGDVVVVSDVSELPENVRESMDEGEADESRAAKVDKETRFQNALKKLEDALRNRTSAHRVVYNEELGGWVDVDWGKLGQVGEPFEKEKNGKTIREEWPTTGAMGLSHVIDKRSAGDLRSPEEMGAILRKLARTLAEGKISRKDGTLRLTYKRFTVPVGRLGGNRYVITAYGSYKTEAAPSGQLGAAAPLPATLKARNDRSPGTRSRNVSAIASTIVDNGLLFKRSESGAIQAVYAPASGKTYIIASNIKPGDERGVFLHEVGVHMAVAQGDAAQMTPLVRRAQQIVQNGYANGDPLAQRVHQRLEDAGLLDESGRIKKGNEDEAYAYLVEEFANDPARAARPIREWFANVVSRVKSWLYGHGFRSLADHLNERDLAVIAVANARTMADTKAGGNREESAGSSPKFSRAPTGRYHSGRIQGETLPNSKEQVTMDQVSNQIAVKHLPNLSAQPSLRVGNVIATLKSLPARAVRSLVHPVGRDELGHLEFRPGRDLANAIGRGTVSVLDDTIKRLDSVTVGTLGIAKGPLAAAYTSQCCPVCKHVDRKNRHGDRFHCMCCGYKADADVNAAGNILERAHNGLFTRYLGKDAVRKILKEEHEKWLQQWFLLI